MCASGVSYQDWEAENHHLIEQHKKYVEQVTEEYEGQLKSESMQRDNIASNKIIREKEFDQQVCSVHANSGMDSGDLKMLLSTSAYIRMFTGSSHGRGCAFGNRRPQKGVSYSAMNVVICFLHVHDRHIWLDCLSQ